MSKIRREKYNSKASRNRISVMCLVLTEEKISIHAYKQK